MAYCPNYQEEPRSRVLGKVMLMVKVRVKVEEEG